MTDQSGLAGALSPDRRPGRVDRDGFYRLSPFELVTGWVGGFEAVDGPIDAAMCGPRQRFEEAVLRSLLHPPCVVAFSGGRDSSAILAVATHLARREGLPEPIAATHDFTGLGDADETAWQEIVISHLGVREWHRVTDADAFDVLGERARNGLRRYGVLFPALAHCHEPLAELARGGSLVIGEGGDEVLGQQRMAPIRAVARNPRHLLKKRPFPVDTDVVRYLVESALPPRARRAIHRRTMTRMETPMHPWLSPLWQESFRDQQAQDWADAPLRWDYAVLRHLGRRAAVTAMTNIRRVLADQDVTLHTPFLDRNFAGSLAAAGGRFGYVSRTGMMRMLFGDLLPDEICRRDEKARFNSVAVSRPSQMFLDSWNGQGLDSEIVDIEAFRRACSTQNPMFGTQLLLQTAWLAMQPDGFATTPTRVA